MNGMVIFFDRVFVWRMLLGFSAAVIKDQLIHGLFFGRSYLVPVFMQAAACSGNIAVIPAAPEGHGTPVANDPMITTVLPFPTCREESIPAALDGVAMSAAENITSAMPIRIFPVSISIPFLFWMGR